MRGISMFALAVLFSATTLMFAVRAATNESLMEEFSVKEYEDFHRVLHPLQHEALPKKRLSAHPGQSRGANKTRQSYYKAGRSSRYIAGKCGGIQQGAEEVWQSTDRI